MTGHAHEFAPRGALPEPICPGIEVLVHRRATELATARPRRRVAVASGFGGVAVAAVCALLFVVLGSPSGSGLLSPRQAVAAVVQSLNGDGVLHWVRGGDLVESPDEVNRPGTIVEEEWTDLATGNSHMVATRTPRDGQPWRRLTWRTADGEWFALNAGVDGLTRIRQTPHLGLSEVTAVEDVRALLERAERGQAEIAAAGEVGGQPLAVVTERREQIVRRVWITREEHPRVVRTETTFVSRNAARPIATTSTTTTWEIVPPTPEALADVEIPTDAKRVP